MEVSLTILIEYTVNYPDMSQIHISLMHNALKNQNLRDLFLDLSSRCFRPAFSKSNTLILHFPLSFLCPFCFCNIYFSFLWVYVLFNFKGDCRIIFNSNFKFYWHVYVNLRILPVTFIGFCYFYFDLCEDVVVLFLHYDTSVNFFYFLL